MYVGLDVMLPTVARINVSSQNTVPNRILKSVLQVSILLPVLFILLDGKKRIC
jgi:hypothetical protein